MDPLSTYLALVIYLGLGTVVALFSYRFLKKDTKDFFTAGGRFGTLLSSLSYAATTYSAFMFIGLVGLAYSTGVGTMGFELVYFVGTLFLLYYIAPKYWVLHNRFGYISPAEVLSERYGSRIVGAAITLLALVSLIPYASSQVIGVAIAAEGASGGAVPYTWAVVIAIVVALLWSVIAGIWSVGWTDVLQGIIMLGTGILMVLWVYIWGYSNANFDLASLGSLSYVSNQPNQFWSFAVFLNMTVPWFFFAVTNPQVVQRLFAPKDRKALNGMIVWFGVYGLLFTVLVTLLGLMLRGMTLGGTFPLIDIIHRDSVTPTLLGMAPLWLSVLGLVAVLAASVSTIDAILLTLSSMSVRDILIPYRPSQSAKTGLLVGRIVIIVLALACTLFALSKPGFIVDLAVLSSSLLLPQAPVVIGMFVWKRGGKVSATLAVVSGFTVAVVLYFLKVSPLSIPTNVWTLFVSTLVYVGAAMMEKAPEGAQKFIKAWKET
ncbi:MAG: sodium:solute symporter family protein [Candidatus Methanomethyliaceae archaeon]|nr:sodium:solute symporter family protein [Candidatus Methanomethyliaceae archaeon]